MIHVKTKQCSLLTLTKAVEFVSPVSLMAEQVYTPVSYIVSPDIFRLPGEENRNLMFKKAHKKYDLLV